MRFRSALVSLKRISLRHYIGHLWQKLAISTLGALFVSGSGQRLRERIAYWRIPARWPGLRVAVVAHLYYLDLLPEILACRSVLPDGTPLHLTVPVDRIGEALRMAQDTSAVIIHPCENRGRDIAPFISLLNAGTFDTYDAVLKLHTKRSLHLLDGEVRRKLLFAALAGERNATWRSLAAFERPDTGIVGWKACYRKARAYWMENESRARQVAAEMQVPASTIRLGFFEGSMFWFRPAALMRLRALALRPEDFEAEAGQLDGTLHHAIERCFTIAALADGYSVRDLRGRVLS